MRMLNRLALRSATAVTSTSDFMVPHVHELMGRTGTVHKVPYGVDTDLFRPGVTGSRRGLTIGFVKHLKPKYGPGDLLTAVARIRPHIPDLRVVMAGEGELRSALAARAASLGIDDIVEFPGRIPHEEVPALMRSLDILANPSVDRSESFGVAILEASASAVPVVVTDVGGIREVARHEETALLVAPAQPDELADALLRLANDPELRTRLGRDGREFVQRTYEWDDNVSSMLDILQSVVR
jgi:glycosyltransferase involved in cell wall biosynthesis